MKRKFMSAKFVLLIFDFLIYQRHSRNKHLLSRIHVKNQDLLAQLQFLSRDLQKLDEFKDEKVYTQWSKIQIKNLELQLEIQDVQADIQKFEKLAIPKLNYVFTSSVKKHCNTSLIASFTYKLEMMFPVEWEEWQHWISDIIESQVRMQSKGMNHRLVSLITFYRLTRFAFHIGIDKVFILATRRITR